MIRLRPLATASLMTVILVSIFFLVKGTFEVKFYNKTGSNIDSLIVGTTFIGQLSIDDSTSFRGFRKFHFDGSYPYETLTASIQNKRLCQLNWSWCGTDRKVESFGIYAFDIKMKSLNGKVGLYLVRHGEKLFSWD